MVAEQNLSIVKDAEHASVERVAAKDDRLRDEAFERNKKDAIESMKGNLSPDIYLSTNRPGPWKIPPAGPPLPDTTKPLPPSFPPDKPIPPNPGDVLKNHPEQETVATKISREALVIGGGVGQSFFYGIANLPAHIPQIASSVAIGGTLAALSKTGRLGQGVAVVVGGYFASRFILDTIHDHKRWSKFSEAVQDTWKSDEHFWKNMRTVRDTAGNWTFDTALSMGSGYVGWKNPQLGEWAIKILRLPPIVPNSPPPFNPRIVTTGMYMSLLPPAGFYRRYEDRTPFAPSSWTIDIHEAKGTLRRNGGNGITRTPDLVGPNQDNVDFDFDEEGGYRPRR